MPNFSGREIGLELLRFYKKGKVRGISLFSQTGEPYVGYRLVRSSFHVVFHIVNECCSVPVSILEWKQAGTLNRPYKIVQTKSVVKISFEAERGGKTKRFIWLKDGIGMPIDEILLESIFVDDKRRK